MPDRDNHRNSPGLEHSRPDKPAGDSSRPGLTGQQYAFRTSLKDIVGDIAEHRSPPSVSTSEETQDAMARIFEAQEETARRIAQNLHDEASQMLALVYLELANIARKSSKSTAQHIERVIGHLDSVCEQMRGLSHELHPMALERHGLLPALNQLAEGVRKRSGLEIDVIGEVDGLPKSIELGLYRVVQEALSNVVRHADATRAEVRLWIRGNRVHCSVRDDGTGFQLERRDSGTRYDSGLGLVGILERVDSLGGECHILSGNRQGMELSVGIPL